MFITLLSSLKESYELCKVKVLSFMTYLYRYKLFCYDNNRFSYLSMVIETLFTYIIQLLYYMCYIGDLETAMWSLLFLRVRLKIKI